MADIAAPTHFWTTLKQLWIPSAPGPTTVESDYERDPSADIQRAVLQDLFEISPEGFASELDVQQMLYMLPCRY